jgi:hypothetical protein
VGEIRLQLEGEGVGASRVWVLTLPVSWLILVLFSNLPENYCDGFFFLSSARCATTYLSLP